MKELTVIGQDAKQRLDKYLKRVFPEMGTSFMYKMLRKKNITLNKKKATGTEQIQIGDVVQCFFSDETFNKFAGNVAAETKDNGSNKCNLNSSGSKDIRKWTIDDFCLEYKKAYDTLKGISVIYEDEHILLLDKPAGVLSQKAKPEDISLNEWMIGYLLASGSVSEDSLKRFKPSVCNRLDRNTSGLVICGKTLTGSREMSRMLKDRSLQKYYRAYVHGRLEWEKTLTAYHRKDSKSNQAAISFHVSDAEKKAYDEIITSYRSIEAKENYSYLEIELVTGKTHQIRAHLSAYGHPIVGDSKYGAVRGVGKNGKNSDTKNERTFLSQEKTANYPKYQLLHAYRIVFPELEGDLAYLSGKEFICEEPKAFEWFESKHFI